MAEVSLPVIEDRAESLLTGLAQSQAAWLARPDVHSHLVVALALAADALEAIKLAEAIAVAPRPPSPEGGPRG